MHPFRPFNSLPALERTLCSTGGEGRGEGYDLRRGGGGRKRRWLILRECPKVNALKKGNYVDQLFNAGKLNNSAGKKQVCIFFMVSDPWFWIPGLDSLVSAPCRLAPWFRILGLDTLVSATCSLAPFRFGSLVSNFWFRVPGLDSLVSHLWFRIHGIGYLFSNPWFRITGFSFLQFGIPSSESSFSHI